MKTSGSKRAAIPALSPREIEILKLICAEKTSGEIGHELNLSERTVEAYRYRMISRLGVSNLVGLVRFAIKEKIYQL